MRMTPKDKECLLKALVGQDDERTVEADADTGITAKTVKELRELPSWPGGFAVVTPTEPYPEVPVKISKQN